MSLRLRSITIISILSLIALGAIALTGLWHPNAPAEAMLKYLPQITLPTVLVAGVVDGINPCAFTVLLLFVTALTSTLQAGEANVKAMRARLLGMGGAARSGYGAINLLPRRSDRGRVWRHVRWQGVLGARTGADSEKRHPIYRVPDLRTRA